MIVALVGTFQLMKLLFTQWVPVEFKFRDMFGDWQVVKNYMMQNAVIREITTFNS